MVCRCAPPGLQVDTGGSVQQLDFGLQRLSNVADTRLGRELDPEKVLGPARHGEWSTGFGGKGAGGCGRVVGVTLR